MNRGRHGFVIKAVDKLTGQDVAIKFLERSSVSFILLLRTGMVVHIQAGCVTHLSY